MISEPVLHVSGHGAVPIRTVPELRVARSRRPRTRVGDKALLWSTQDFGQMSLEVMQTGGEATKMPDEMFPASQPPIESGETQSKSQSPAYWLEEICN